MSTHSKVFNSLSSVHQRTLHELHLIHNNLLTGLSEDSSAFLVEHPEIVREELGILFERDPFDFRDSNVLFHCPVTRTVSEIQPSTSPPNYNSDSDNSFGSVVTMSSLPKKKQDKTKKNENTSDDYDDQDNSTADDNGHQNSCEEIPAD